MKNAAMSEELYQISFTEWREEELYQQAQDEYEAQLARVPLRVDYASDEDYEAALVVWDDITQTLLDRAKELERVK